MFRCGKTRIHVHCNNCRGKFCSVDDCCSDDNDWADELWEKLSAYSEKLAIQREKEKERKQSLHLFLVFRHPVLCQFPYLN